MGFVTFDVVDFFEGNSSENAHLLASIPPDRARDFISVEACSDLAPPAADAPFEGPSFRTFELL